MPSVAVVGGSLGGLTAALLLRDLGCDVTVYERSSAALQARGAGIAVLEQTLRYPVERLGLATHAYGIAGRALELTVQYCRDRETFGKPLISNQVVRHKLVEMRRQVEVSRVYAREVARRHVVPLGVQFVEELTLDQVHLPEVRRRGVPPYQVEVLDGGAGVGVALDADAFDQPYFGDARLAEAVFVVAVDGIDLHVSSPGTSRGRW